MPDPISGPLERVRLAAAPVVAWTEGDRFAARLRGFGPLGLVAILIIVAGNWVVIPLSAVLVLVWARWSGTPWEEIGYVRPRSWIGDLLVGIAFGGVLKIVMKSVVMPLLGADPINQAYHYLAGNSAAIPSTLYLVIVGAGFGEETFFRGFLFERLGKIFGSSVSVWMLMCAHAAFDLTAYAIIYWNLEPTFAHLVFR